MKDFKKTLKTLVLPLVLAALSLCTNNLYAQSYTSNRGLFDRGEENSFESPDFNAGLWNRGTLAITGGITNDDLEMVPLGSGVAILLAAGAGYAIVRRKRSRKGTALLLAFGLLLGFAQCKKEQPLEPETQNGKVSISLAVNGNNNSRAIVDPPHVTFSLGDQILVVSDGHYVGTLNYNGSIFSGDITDPVEGEPLYFYFLGNNQGAMSVGDDGCTVNISDQSNAPYLPMISMGASINRSNNEIVNYSSEVTSYEARLHNKCSVIKCEVTTPSNSPICIKGMNNKVTIDFSKAANDNENNGFSYDKEGEGIIKLQGGSGSPAEKLAVVLPQPELAAGEAGSAYAQNGTYTTFTGSRPAIHAIEANGYYYLEGDMIAMTVDTPTNIVDLGDIDANTTIANGKTVIGTLANNVKISIADGATVTLDGVTINGTNDSSYSWAGITCEGDATIVLSGTNTVKGFDYHHPGIRAAEDKTLTIQGNGLLTASSNGMGAGIGGGLWNSCGNIVIHGGTITATGANGAAGIGGGTQASCGNILIQGGTITATGGYGAAGIGGGNEATFGDITITNGVTSVTAIKGEYSNADTHSIGAGSNCIGNTYLNITNCGTVTIGGTLYGAYNTSAHQWKYYNGGEAYLSQSPLVYPNQVVTNLSYLHANHTMQNGETLTGTLGHDADVKISIADGATVTLDNVTINGTNNSSYSWAGITCLGDATIILSGTNTVKGFYETYPGIQGAVGKTLTIQGNGSLTASSNGWAAGIGGGLNNINGDACGDIEILGGTITANGGNSAAGIGSGYHTSCGNITIANTVTRVTATKGEGAPNSIGAGEGGGCGTVTIGGTVYWNGSTYQNGGLAYLGASMLVYPAPMVTNLSTLTGDYTAHDDETLTGTLTGFYKVSIADGATVTLAGVTINGLDVELDTYWAGLTCLGDATIILAHGTTNTVRGFGFYHPGIQGAEGKTLTIKGTGSLDASCYGSAAGIGCGYEINCGNILIQGGTITATGGGCGAGIGGGPSASCGDINITGGTVTATGGEGVAGYIGGAGIGSGYRTACGDIAITGGTVTATGGYGAAGIGGGDGLEHYPNLSSCGVITILASVTSVTAIKGENAPNSIGPGAHGGMCVRVHIGGTIYWDGAAYQNGGENYLTQSPLIYYLEP